MCVWSIICSGNWNAFNSIKAIKQRILFCLLITRSLRHKIFCMPGVKKMQKWASMLFITQLFLSLLIPMSQTHTHTKIVHVRVNTLAFNLSSPTTLLTYPWRYSNTTPYQRHSWLLNDPFHRNKYKYSPTNPINDTIPALYPREHPV